MLLFDFISMLDTRSLMLYTTTQFNLEVMSVFKIGIPKNKVSNSNQWRG